MSSTRRNLLKKRLRRVVYVLIVAYVMIAASLHVLQEKLIFLPTTLAQDYQYEFNYPFEEVFLEPETDVLLNAIHFKAKSPKGVILYFHGNAGDLSRWGTIAEFFVEKNYDVFILDYRTYGKSKGPLSEAAFYRDATACYDHLLNTYDESDIVLYGRSLGTGIATFLASKFNPRQLILETPYYSIVDVAKNRFPIFPVKTLLKYQFRSHDFIASVNCPITMIHGTLDAVIPISSAQKLKAVAPPNTKFFTVEGGRHNNLVSFEAYQNAINEVL